MAHPSLIAPNRLLAYYRAGTITRTQWLHGMRQHFLLAFAEIEEDRSDPKRALLETWRCKNAARRLKKNHTEAELREVFLSLSALDDFPPATYLWNADQRDVPLHCFLREKRTPVLRFGKMEIHRLTARLIIEYGGLKAKDCLREKIHMRRDWRGTLIVESREPL
ncbi:MAG: hypothetical protein H7A51_11605 [Akkermansiaceae bacterium]|nr:hypothetical protein [Akkermansiaceae bacterium]